MVVFVAVNLEVAVNREVAVREVSCLLTLSLICFSASGFLVMVLVNGTLVSAGAVGLGLDTELVDGLLVAVNVGLVVVYK